MPTVDAVYVAASARDPRYTRICLGITHSYPEVPVKLLVGGALEDGLAEELARYRDVGVSNVRLGHWGSDFVKLEPLFGLPGERFLVCRPLTHLHYQTSEPWLLKSQGRTSR